MGKSLDGTWIKFREKFSDVKAAKDRMNYLKNFGMYQVAQVRCSKAKGRLIVTYAVAHWFKKECDQAGRKI